jgi:hypothetical protein
VTGRWRAAPCPLSRPQTEGGWRLSLDCGSHPGEQWGALLPALKAAVKRWPHLLAAQRAKVDPVERVGSSWLDSQGSGWQPACLRPLPLAAAAS